MHACWCQRRRQCLLLLPPPPPPLERRAHLQSALLTPSHRHKCSRGCAGQDRYQGIGARPRTTQGKLQGALNAQRSVVNAQQREIRECRTTVAHTWKKG